MCINIPLSSRSITYGTILISNFNIPLRYLNPIVNFINDITINHIFSSLLTLTYTYVNTYMCTYIRTYRSMYTFLAIYKKNTARYCTGTFLMLQKLLFILNKPVPVQYQILTFFLYTIVLYYIRTGLDQSYYPPDRRMLSEKKNCVIILKNSI